MNTWKWTIGLLTALMLAVASLGFAGGSALAAPVLQDSEPEIEFTGTVLSFDETAGTLEVEVETEEDGIVTYTVFAPEDFDFSELAEGDLVEVEGILNEDGDVEAEKIVIESEEDEDDELDDEDDEAEDGEEENFFCANPDELHPVGQGIAETYEVTYEEVMAWFCGEDDEDGFGFGQIMLALSTGEMTGDSADDLLARREAGEGWGEIWQDLGLIGRPEDAGPPEDAGRPEDAGPPDDAGRPADAGPPADAGRPDDAGPPEGVPPQ